MKRILALALALLAPIAAAQAQGVLQSGPWTPGHAPMYVGQGSSQPVLQDSGPASGGSVGVGLSELGLTVRGIGSPPFANAGTGPFGTNLCDYDAPTNSAAYHYLCFSPNAQGGGLIAYGAAGTAAPLPLYLKLNGTTYQFPFTVGGVVGPVSTTVGDMALWNNGVGSLLSDGGPPLRGPSPTVVGHVALWNNLTGTLLQDGGVPVTGPVSTTVGHLVTWNNTTGTLLSDGGAGSVPFGINFLNYGADPSGVGDNTAAYNSFLAACQVAVSKQCYIPAGQYLFNSQPNCIHNQITLFGDNLGASILYKNYNQPNPQGLICFDSFLGNDSVIRDLGLYSKAGTTGGAMISMIGPVGSPIGFLSFYDIVISTTGSCTVDYDIFIDGTGNSVAPIGVRDINFTNMSLFGQAVAAMYISGVEGLAFNGGGIFPAGCANASSGAVYVVGSVAVNSNYINMSAQTMQGGFNFSHASGVIITTNAIGTIAPGVSIQNDGTADSISVKTTSMGGTYQQSWVRSSVQIPGLGIYTGIPLNTGAQSGYLCYNASTGAMTYDNANTCFVSSGRYKDVLDVLDPGESLDKVMRLEPIAYRYKPDLGLPASVFLGLIAEDVSKVEKRIVSLDGEGQPRSVEYDRITLLLVGAVQQLERELDDLRRTRQ